MPFLQAALNGDRDHPATPRTPDEIAAEAVAAVRAGAMSLHLHAFDRDGRQTLAANACAAVLRAVRAVCPGIPLSLTTSADIEPDPRKRLELVTAWTDLPELVTANMGEDGILPLCDLLDQRAVGIEAGLLSVDDARAFVAANVAARCVRALIEPLDADPAEAIAHAERIEDVLAQAGLQLEQVHHGNGVASWAVNRRALERGHGIRTGLEDTPVLADGRPALGNAELVTEAATLIDEIHR